MPMARELRQPDTIGNLFRMLVRPDCRYSYRRQLWKADGTRYYYHLDTPLDSTTSKVLNVAGPTR
ncbi:hypothetical protein [Hymenobacter metallicola]|uniref:Uncharacterized protein n=1 Tax=Hymenobacter metallicola TaxID=2563114 RepID=A0A4Z0QJK9_9BACT|nr:hypothetical protein [Hymenobacter metallicola]TGE29459.1 hypothetical protein E5K02_08400 [Hymenobacter metallicola]